MQNHATDPRGLPVLCLFAFWGNFQIVIHLKGPHFTLD